MKNAKFLALVFVADGGGKATLTTVGGQTLTVEIDAGNAISLTDNNGNKAYVQTADVR